jgi:pimeloyl-ACP methyl ester carboxylesterase
MDTVEVHGLRLAYRRAGHGPPVMFVHGGIEDSRAWTPQLDALSDEFTVIAWDEPGAGGSQDVPDEFGLPDYADCLAATTSGDPRLRTRQQPPGTGTVQ